MTDRMLQSARSGKKRAGQGDLIHHLQGKKLTQRQAIKAKCYDCNGMGELDTCDITICPLYPYSPYTRNMPGHAPAKQCGPRKGIVHEHPRA